MLLATIMVSVAYLKNEAGHKSIYLSPLSVNFIALVDFRLCVSIGS
jgi:hypothetical protein